MSKKPQFDISSLLAEKGGGIPSHDAPGRSIIKEAVDEKTKVRTHENYPSKGYVNLGFKVPKEFRHRIRKIAASKDISLVQLLKEAIDLYESQNDK